MLTTRLVPILGSQFFVARLPVGRQVAGSSSKTSQAIAHDQWINFAMSIVAFMVALKNALAG